MPTSNALNISQVGLITFDGTNIFTGSPIAQHDILVGGVANAVVSVSPSTSGFVLTSNGTLADPSFQSASASGAVTTITGDSGGAETPSAGNFNIVGGTTGLTFAGSANTETLTGTLILANGGTSAALTASNGGIFYSSATAGAILSGTATARQMLQSGASTTPAWSTTTWPATSTVNRILYSSSTSVIGEITTAIDGVLITDHAAGVPSILANGTAGFVLTANSGAPPSWQANSSLAWSVITVNQTAAINNGYITNKAGTLALALPATSAVGSIIEVTGINTATGTQFTQAAGQQIFLGNSSTTLGATGTITSTGVRDSLRMVCVVADTIWNVLSSTGAWTIV